MKQFEETFAAKLFDLFDIADKVVIDGYEIEMINDMGGSKGDEIVRCEVSDEHEWSFRNQDVSVSKDGGSCVALTAGDDEMEEDPCEVRISFRMERKIEENDLISAKYRELGILVIQESEKVVDDDAFVAGTYSVMVSKSLSPGDQASAALDCFHEAIPVEVLDDFTFWVFDPKTGLVIHEGDAESYSLGREARDVQCSGDGDLKVFHLNSVSVVARTPEEARSIAEKLSS